MHTVTRDDIRAAVAAAGIGRGQVVFVYADLRTVGMIKGVRDRAGFCDAWLQAIFDVIGPSGTLVVPTYTTQVARFDIEFILESTPTPMGIFPEFVRACPGAIRSVHPLLSLTAYGADAAAVCGDNGTSAYGVDSPFARLLESGARIMSIGLDRYYSVGVAHHLEAACSLPYCYNKLLKWQPVVAGRRLNRQYFATVRYPEFLGIPYNFHRLAQAVEAVDGIRTAPLGGSRICSADYRQAFDIGRRALRDDPYLFLSEPPPFVYGTVPFDGPTASHDRVVAPGDVDRLAHMNWSGYYL
jgi:aminoglycoside 3-N-acetyltransferase